MASRSRPFNPQTSYRPELDVRAWEDLAELVAHSDPEGLLWPLVGPRRSGKTWALRGVQHALGRQRAAVVNLQHDSAEQLRRRRIGPDTVLLDEPGRHLFRAHRVGPGAREADSAGVERFFEWCRGLRDAGKRLLLAMTPAEWTALCSVGRERGLLSNKDLQPHLRPLDREQALRIAGDDRDATALLQRLAARSPDWLRNPYLVWLILDRAQQRDLLGATSDGDFDQLFELARAEANARGSTNYVGMVFYEGLAPRQQAALRQIARGTAPDSDAETLALLRTSGLIGSPKAEAEAEAVFPEGIRDPLLADHLPPPLRIHHISDLHAGPKTALRVNQGAPGEVATKLAQGAGQGSIREGYREHVEQRRRRGDGPHLIVASGDLTETGRPEEYAEARRLLEALDALTSPHPDLDADASRVLVVGGNHDVDWRHTRGAEGARKRHLPFARELDGFPRPHLEVPPEERELAAVTYADAGLEIILLGSSEYGGEIDELLVDLIDRVRESALQGGAPAPGGRSPEELQTLRDRLSRLDPGLVHNEDLSRLRASTKLHPLRIAVLHHPVSPLPTTTDIAPYAGLLNAGAVKSALLDAGVDVVLHGHMHSAWLAEERWADRDGTLRIAAAPSLSSREVHEAHGYNEILLYREGDDDFRVEIRAFARSGDTWAQSSALGPFTVRPEP